MKRSPLPQFLEPVREPEEDDEDTGFEFAPDPVSDASPFLFRPDWERARAEMR